MQSLDFVSRQFSPDANSSRLHATPTKVDLSRAPKELILRSTGQLPTDAELQDLRAAGALTASTSSMIDLRESQHMPTHDTCAAEAGVPITEKQWPLRRAYLVRRGRQYGIARQMQAYAPDGMEVAVFTEEQPALDWVGSLSNWNNLGAVPR